MDMKQFSSLMVYSANEAKNLMSLLIGHYNHVEAAPAILGLYESFPEEYRKETKLFTPIFVKFFSTYGVDKNTYEYYKIWSERFSSDFKKSIRDANPEWNWDKEPSISFKNSLELSKAIANVQNGFDRETRQRISAVPFFEEFSSEITRLIKKDKNKIVENFHKHKIWHYLIEDNYSFMKQFCQQYDMDVMAIVKREIASEHGYGMCELVGYRAMPFRELNILLNDIQAYGVEEFFENSDFLKPPRETDSMHLGIAETVLFGVCYGHVEHASLIAMMFEEFLIQYLPWDEPEPYNDEKWQKYCEEKEQSNYTYYGMQNHHLRNLKDDEKSNIGTLLKKTALKFKLENNLPEKETQGKRFKV